MKFKCPHCHQHLEIDDQDAEEYAGQDLECPQCQNTIVVSMPPLPIVISEPQGILDEKRHPDHRNPPAVPEQVAKVTKCPECYTEIPFRAFVCKNCLYDTRTGRVLGAQNKGKFCASCYSYINSRQFFVLGGIIASILIVAASSIYLSSRKERRLAIAEQAQIELQRKQEADKAEEDHLKIVEEEFRQKQEEARRTAERERLAREAEEARRTAERERLARKAEEELYAEQVDIYKKSRTHDERIAALQVYNNYYPNGIHTSDILSLIAKATAADEQLEEAIAIFYNESDSDDIFGYHGIYSAATKDSLQAQVMIGELWARNLQKNQDTEVITPFPITDADNLGKWLVLAAETGLPCAQYQMGITYGEPGVKQDYSISSNWLRKAADQEHAAAQFMLAGLYINGFGVRKDREAAVKWLRKSAAQGYERAIITLKNIPEGRTSSQYGASDAETKSEALSGWQPGMPLAINDPNAEAFVRRYMDGQYNNARRLCNTASEADAACQQLNMAGKVSLDSMREAAGQAQGEVSYVGKFQVGRWVYRYDENLDKFVVYQE